MLKESESMPMMLLVETRMLMMAIATTKMKIPGRRDPADYGGFERIEVA
jgi:hypothetical protein